MHASSVFILFTIHESRCHKVSGSNFRGGIPRRPYSINHAEQFRLQDVLPLFVFLALLERLVIFPSHGLLALPANNISDKMPARGHIAFHSFSLCDVDDGVEEVGFAMLAAEVLSRSRTLARLDKIRVGVRMPTLLMISSLLARCVLQCLQPKILVEFR
jgi:hypothetical protein